MTKNWPTPLGHTQLFKGLIEIRSHSLDKLIGTWTGVDNFGCTLGWGQSFTQAIEIRSHSLDKANHYLDRGG